MSYKKPFPNGNGKNRGSLVDLIEFGHPQRAVRVAWHAPVATRGKGNRADLDAIGHAVALELLREEAAVKSRDRLPDRFFGHFRKRQTA